MEISQYSFTQIHLEKEGLTFWIAKLFVYKKKSFIAVDISSNLCGILGVKVWVTYSKGSQISTETVGNICSRVMRFQSRPTNSLLLTIESPVTQRLEHPTRSRRVLGSNPIWDSDFFSRALHKLNIRRLA